MFARWPGESSHPCMIACGEEYPNPMFSPALPKKPQA